MELDQKTIKKLRGLIIFTVAVIVAGINYRSVAAAAGRLLHLLFPFILGSAIAFILNVPMNLIEKQITIKSEGLRRVVSLVITIAGVLGVLLLVLFVVLPQLFDTFRILHGSIPGFLEEAKVWIEQTFANQPELLALLDSIQIDWQAVVSEIAGFLKNGAGSVLSGTISAAVSIVNGVTSFGIGFIFAVYILLQKETLGRQAKKFTRAFLSGKTAEKLFHIAGLASKIFSSFLAGQCVEAVILGTMFFAALFLLRLPYALLIGVLIAFTALIPIFGAFIGLAVGVFLMLMENPLNALIFTVVFFILQQIEGNLIYPHVVGGSVGLPSIWVLVAVTVGGSAFGIVGMLVFIPLCSVLYALLRDEVNRRLLQKPGPVPKQKRKNDSGFAPL
ncbi:MAG: AI-2E family transporter [Lachnospiraceae bacterium]|nr:AI-2E family transporter [Lachnospiraceae bacterium]